MLESSAVTRASADTAATPTGCCCGSALRQMRETLPATGLRADIRRLPRARFPRANSTPRRATTRMPPIASLCARRCSSWRNSSGRHFRRRRSCRRSATTTKSAATTSCSRAGRFSPTPCRSCARLVGSVAGPGFDRDWTELRQLQRSGSAASGCCRPTPISFRPVTATPAVTRRRRPRASDPRMARGRARGGKAGPGAGLAALSHPAGHRRLCDAARRGCARPR